MERKIYSFGECRLKSGLIWTILFFVLGSLSHVSAAPDGEGCGEVQAETPTTKVDVAGLSEAGKEPLAKISAEATNAINSISIDTKAARDWLLSAVEGKGWAAAKIAKAVADMIAEAEAELERQIKDQLPKIIKQATDTLEASLELLDPKAKFQADHTWEESCCDQGSWSDSAANKAGITGAEGEGKADFKFDIGASVGLEATLKASLSVTLAAGIKLTGFNPVRPKSGTGSSIKIVATPIYDWNVKASAGAGITLKITVGVGLTGSDTLPDVSGNLNCSN